MEDTMPKALALEALTHKEYTPKQWLTYYKNIWVRNNIARSIDVNCDQEAKKINRNELVIDPETGQQITVSERLEMRKIALQDGLDIIAGIDRLLAIEEDKFVDQVWSKEALKVDEDMLPKAEDAAPKAGDVCKMPDGTDGVLVEDGGALVCKLPAVNSDAPGAEAKV